LRSPPSINKSIFLITAFNKTKKERKNKKREKK